MAAATPVEPGHSLLLWAAREDEPQQLRLVCAEAADQVQASPDEVVVAWRGCLSELPAAVPFELLNLGVEAVVLDQTGCEQPWPTDWAGLGLVAGVSERLLIATEPQPGQRRAKRVLDAAAMPVLRRRSLFGLGAAAEQPPVEPPHGGTAQQRLRDAVRALASTSQTPVEAPADGWTSGAHDLVADGCVACRVCVQTCPEQALALESQTGRAGLGFDPSLCTGCGRCLTVCDAEALTSRGRLGPPALLQAPVLLELLPVKTCARCRTIFRGAGQYCPVCAYRVANPFGSTLPPGGWIPANLSD